MNLAHTFMSNLTILRDPLCRLSRSGLPCSDDWLTKIQPWVDQWEQADELLVHPTGPHTDSSFRAYLTWYLPRTRARLVYVDTHPQPHQARPQAGYARHHVEALAGTVSSVSYLHIYINIHKIIHVLLTVHLLNGCSFAFAT